MNITLLAAIVCLALWIVLVFAVHVSGGSVHVLYAAGMTLLARRILAGAPSFRS